MKNKLFLQLIIVLLFALSLLSGCSLPGILSKDDTRGPKPDASPMEKAPETSGPAEGREALDKKAETREDPGMREMRPEESNALGGKVKIQGRLEEKEFLAALDLIRHELKHGASEEKMAGPYLKALNGTINKGQRRLDKNEYSRAGRLFRKALDSFPKDPGLAENISATPRELEFKIAFCADKLMERGLTLYRRGQLEEAIELWEKILSFDPHNQASRKAIQTTSTQLSNLKKMNGN